MWASLIKIHPWVITSSHICLIINSPNMILFQSDSISNKIYTQLYFNPAHTNISKSWDVTDILPQGMLWSSMISLSVSSWSSSTTGSMSALFPTNNISLWFWQKYFQQKYLAARQQQWQTRVCLDYLHFIVRQEKLHQGNSFLRI